MGAVLRPVFSQADNRPVVSYAKAFDEIFAYVRGYLTQNRRTTLRGLYDLLPKQVQALYPPQIFIRQYSMFQEGEDIDGYMNPVVASAFLTVMEVQKEKLAPHWGMYEDKLSYIELDELCELIRIHQKYSHRDLEWVYRQLPPEQTEQYPLEKLQTNMKFFLEHHTVSGRVPKSVAYPILRVYEQIKTHDAVTFRAPVLVVDNQARVGGFKPTIESEPETSVIVVPLDTLGSVQETSPVFDMAVSHFIDKTFPIVFETMGGNAQAVVMQEPILEPIQVAPSIRPKEPQVAQDNIPVPRSLFDEQERTHLYGAHIWCSLSSEIQTKTPRHKLSEIFKGCSDDSCLPQNVIDEIAAVYSKVPSWASPVTTREVMIDPPFGTEYSPVMSQKIAAAQLTKVIADNGMTRSALVHKFSEVTGVSYRAAANLFNQGIDTVPRLRVAICFAIAEGVTVSEEAIRVHRYFSEGRVHKNPRPKKESLPANHTQALAG